MFKKLFFIFLGTLFFLAEVQAQDVNPDKPSPRTAFLKSLAMPGWGHYYVDNNNWNRGKYHLGTEIALMLSFVGLGIHSNNLENNWYSYANSEAGIALKNRSRTLRLAVGDFNSLEEYNDFQLRNRNWDRLLDDSPENRWNWPSDEARNEYKDLRNRFENIDQQLPALVGLMVVNRVISAVSAYNRATKVESELSRATLYFSKYHQGSGLIANLKVPF